MKECPAPFLVDYIAATGSGGTVDEKYCRFGCCIPCPAQNLVSFFFTQKKSSHSDKLT